MTKPLVLALALALAAPGVAFATPAAKPAKTAPRPVPAWVARSNRNAQVLLMAQGRFQPEQLSFFGVPGFDDKVADYGPGYGARYREATAEARDELRSRLASEKDPNVRQDLEILIDAADRQIEASAINEKLTRPWLDVGETVFGGLQGLLSDQTPQARRAMALKRLQAYIGTAPGSTALTTLARQRYEERAEAGLLMPTQVEVQQSLDNVATYRAGIKQLFEKYGIDASPSLATLDQQLADYAEWTRSTVLPKARTTYSLPPELYALSLKGVGIDIDPRTLIERAQMEFAETRNAMQQIAGMVAKAHGWPQGDYVSVIRQLKKDPIPNEKIESHYRTVVMPELDRLIAANRVVTLPDRPMQMRVGTPAENASQPAPHFLPAPLVGNTGQQGVFVLPLSNPNAGADGPYDDFNYPAGAWTLSAHEGRPGHELQFTAMVERGISLARTMYAFNSVNVEGWALYAEAEMVPYEPLDGQLIALQLRLLRASRAILDPMLNLGLTDRDTAFDWLVNKVGLSRAMARQEVDRYTVKSPGQAGSYFYGYSQLMQLRTETELALGDRFDRKAFNDFLLDQGLLPPKLLAKAVREQFVPQQKAKNG